MATTYKDNVNVLYEICNEPNGDVTWERDIKPYAEEVIAEIRAIDEDAIIICGTPNWSQDVDIVSENPITTYDNIMYSLHFYAATHKADFRTRLTTAINNGLPVFVSEFGICDASGNGEIDKTEANTWIDLLNKNNISWVCWNLSNKNESSSLLSSTTDKVTDWTYNELSESGKWLVNKIKQPYIEIGNPLKILYIKDLNGINYASYEIRAICLRRIVNENNTDIVVPENFRAKGYNLLNETENVRIVDINCNHNDDIIELEVEIKENIKDELNTLRSELMESGGFLEVHFEIYLNVNNYSNIIGAY